MKAFLIPANSSERVREINFKQDESWRHVLTRYHDPDKQPWIFTEVAFLTKENAPRDYMLRNSRASEYLKNHSDDFDSPENLYGDVIVLGYDRAFEKLTDLPWPHSPEDFEHLLTRIVTAPEPVPTDVDNKRIIDKWEREQAEKRARDPLPRPDPGAPPPWPDPFERGGAPPLW